LEAVAHESRTVHVEWCSPYATAFELGPAHPGTHSFDDERALQFGDRGAA
jgi:hypothetical protein